MNGGSGSDTILGSLSAENIKAGKGDDMVLANGGNDKIKG